MLVSLLEAWCCRGEPTEWPHRHLGSEIWNPPACPVQCCNAEVMNVYDSYPKARLGVCLREDRQPYTVEIQLHRLSCWSREESPLM